MGMLKKKWVKKNEDRVYRLYNIAYKNNSEPVPSKTTLLRERSDKTPLKGPKS